METKKHARLERIEADVKSHIVCSNLNRVCILHLLKVSENQEMQAEQMAYRLGLSHRTVLYHLDILHDYNLVEVRKFRKRGDKLMRSVWGLGRNSHIDKVFKRICKDFDVKQLESMVNQNSIHQ